MPNYTSDHVKPCNIGQSEAHNRRTPEYIAHINKDEIYIRPDLVPHNEEWISSDMEGRNLQQYYDDIAIMVKEKTGRALQTKERTITDKKTGKTKKVQGSSPIRESVLVCSANTTFEQVKLYAQKVHEELHIKPLQIFFHKDEGHYENKDNPGSWIPNYHVHLIWDWMDHTTGKSIKTGKADMSRMQDLAAECLEMDRGRSKEETGKEHLERNDFVISKQRAKIEEQKAESDHLNKENNAKTSRLNELNAQIAEKEEELAQERRGGLDAILSGTANMFGKGKYAAIEKRNKELEEAIPKEKQRLEKEFSQKVKAAVAEQTKPYIEAKKRDEQTITALKRKCESLTCDLTYKDSSDKQELEAMEKRVSWRNDVLLALAKAYYRTSNLFRKVIDAIIDYAHSAFGGNGKHGDIFPNDEVVAIKTIIDQYAENKEARISVGNWLAMFAESQGQLNDYESERAYSEVEDIATGKYDHRLGKGGQGISM